MLPPFVPPSARAVTETLPLITEFVRHPVERSSDQLWKGENQLSLAAAELDPPLGHHEVVSAADVGAAPQVALPSITNFLADRSTRAAAETSNISPSRSAQPWHRVPDDVAQLSDPETLPEPIEGVPVINAIPIVNEYAAPVADHRAASVDHVDAPVQVELLGSSDSIIKAPANIEPVKEASPTRATAAAELETDGETTSEAMWIAEERNAFDWQSVASLAARQNELRAESEWATTNWDRGTTSDAEQVASLLNQVVRRVRAGELKVDAARGMSAESALAATLAALLRSED